MGTNTQWNSQSAGNPKVGLIKIIINYIFTYIFRLLQTVLVCRVNDVSAQHKTQNGSNAQGLTSAEVNMVKGGFTLIKNFMKSLPGSSRRAARARRRRDQDYLPGQQPK